MTILFQALKKIETLPCNWGDLHFADCPKMIARKALEEAQTSPPTFMGGVDWGNPQGDITVISPPAMKYSEVPNGRVFYIEDNFNYPKEKVGLGHVDIRDGCTNTHGDPNWEVILAPTEVKLTYFKESGKYYSEGSFQVLDARPYHKILDEVRRWKAYHAVPLPELSSSHWEGYILVIPQREDLKVPALLDFTLRGELFS